MTVVSICHFLKPVTYLAALMLYFTSAPAQTGKNENQTRTGKVTLIDWKARDCDHTYNPSLIVDRITESSVSNSVTLLTINFADHCCPEFAPEIQFIDNKLLIIPYKEKKVMDICTCNCCFSIQFRIANLPELYDVYFRVRKVVQSPDPYPLVEPSHEVFQGEIVNRKNKYGFKEGKWITFYDSGQVKCIFDYPENELYGDHEDVPTRLFYKSGRLEFSRSIDTAQYWFEDGELRSQFIDYKQGDTTYHYRFSKHLNRRLAEKALERSYPTIFYSDLDSSYQREGFGWDVIYKEEFFDNGQRKYTYGNDTTRSWHPNGLPESIQYKNGGIKYDTTGRINEKSFRWKTKRPSNQYELDHKLYVVYNDLNTVTEVSYVRDEPAKVGVAVGVRYNWKWKDGKLVESPKKWKESLPWERFEEIEIHR